MPMKYCEEQMREDNDEFKPFMCTEDIFLKKVFISVEKKVKTLLERII